MWTIEKRKYYNDLSSKSGLTMSPIKTFFTTGMQDSILVYTLSLLFGWLGTSLTNFFSDKI